MVICSLLWSIAGIFMKKVPWNSFVVSGTRSLISGLTFAVYMIATGKKLIVNRTTLLAGIMTGCVYICFTMANKLTTAANAIALQFTSPVFVMLYSALFFHEKIRKEDLAVVLCTLGGITLFFFDKLDAGKISGNLVAILSGVLMAGMFVAVGRIEAESRFSTILIAQIFTFLVGVPFMLTTKPVLTSTAVISIFILGVFQLGISYILYVKASVACTPLACCLISALEPLLNPVWVFLFDGEKPGLFALIGAAVVIVSITVWSVVKEILHEKEKEMLKNARQSA